jgi:hypothetical protein|tara:strand:+ start:138 stop:980 length:843 start_codon:yes stop_codon:yes gene_type:complete
MKKLYIHCDGGFGNRFNSLIVGLIICHKGKFSPIISWPSTNVCRALYDDIFEDEFEFNSNRLEDYSDSINQFEFVMHDNQLNWNVKTISPFSYTSIEQIVNYYNSSVKNKLFYFNNLIPNYRDLDLSLISNLKFKKEYYDIVNTFLNFDNYFGIHLRATDSPQGDFNFDQIFNSIKNSEKIYFVCSDSLEVENKFNKLKNVFTFPKTSYVDKIDSSFDWRVSRGMIKDEKNKALSFNVERSAQSVKEAIIDLLILSKSDIIPTSNSTFLTTAQLLKQFNL